MRLSDYHYPYVVLISKCLLYFEVNLEDETSELVKSTQELNNGSLSKMGFTKINGRWVSKDGDHGGSSSAAATDFDEEDQATDMDIHNEEQPATNLDARTSVGHQGDGIPSMSSFERYMVDRLDGFAENQRNLNHLCVKISRTLTTDSRAWTLAFRPWMNRLKLFRTRSLSCNMSRMTEEKQPIECSKQLIVFAL